VPDSDPAPESELGVNPAAPRRPPSTPDARPGSGRSARRDGSIGPTAPGSGPRSNRTRHPQHPGGHLHRQPLGGHHRDRFVPPFGGTTFPSITAARSMRS
jgi:hypothetical protein